jgi:hypothetical protein
MLFPKLQFVTKRLILENTGRYYCSIFKESAILIINERSITISSYTKQETL